MSAAAKNQPTLGQEATPPPKRDLTGVFGESGRPRLAPRKAAATSVPKQPPASTGAIETDQAAATADLPPVNEQEPTRRQTAGAGRPRHDVPVSSAADASLTIGRTIYLAGELWEQLAIARARTRQTNTQVVLAAIKATHGRLDDLVAEDIAPTVVKGDLWDEIVTPDRSHQPAKRQVYIQPTRQQLRVIDALVDQSGARDRSHLLAVVLTAYLT